MSPGKKPTLAVVPQSNFQIQHHQDEKENEKMKARWFYSEGLHTENIRGRLPGMRSQKKGHDRALGKMKDEGCPREESNIVKLKFEFE